MNMLDERPQSNSSKLLRDKDGVGQAVDQLSMHYAFQVDYKVISLLQAIYIYICMYSLCRRNIPAINFDCVVNGS